MAKPKEFSTVELFLYEYDKLKSEQIQRLGFRDNLVYANLIAMAAIISIAATDVIRTLVLLVLPMTCVVLGWTYLVNDEKISAIGRYIRHTLADKIRAAIQSDDQDIFGWETAHRSDKMRVSRKMFQLIIDQFVFVIPGFIAILVFWINAPNILLPLRWLALAEAIPLIILGAQIYLYADLKQGK